MSKATSKDNNTGVPQGRKPEDEMRGLEPSAPTENSLRCANCPKEGMTRKEYVEHWNRNHGSGEVTQTATQERLEYPRDDAALDYRSNYKCPSFVSLLIQREKIGDDIAEAFREGALWQARRVSPAEQQETETLKKCLFQMQEAAKDLAERLDKVHGLVDSACVEARYFGPRADSNDGKTLNRVLDEIRAKADALARGDVTRPGDSKDG